MAVDYRLIGSRIKARRKAQGFTQEQIAEKLSVTVGYISQIERGVTKISLDTLSNIGTVLNVDIAFFVSGVTVSQTSYLQQEFHQKYSRLSQVQKQMLAEFADIMIKYK